MMKEKEIYRRKINNSNNNKQIQFIHYLDWQIFDDEVFFLIIFIVYIFRSYTWLYRK